MPAILSAHFEPTPERVKAYDEGWEIGRSGQIKLPRKYTDQPDLSGLYCQGYFDAHAGREKNIQQDRTYSEQ